MFEDDEPTIGKLIGDVQRDLASLVRNEIQLAKAEIGVNAKTSGLGIGLFAVAGLLGLLAIILASIGLAYLINLTGLGLVWCYFIVCGLYLLIAGILSFIGYRKIRKVRGPQKTIAQAQQTAQILKRD